MSRLSMLLLACLALLSVDAVLAAKSPGPSREARRFDFSLTVRLF